MGKNRSQLKKGIRSVLHILLCATLVFIRISSVSADDLEQEIDETKQKIRESESEIQNAKDQKGRLNSGLEGAKQLLQSLKNSKSDAESYIQTLDSGMEEIQSRITEIEEEISANEILAEQAQDELEAAEEERENQYEDMKKHLRFMYTAETGTFFDILTSASGIGDLLNKNTYIEAVTEYDDRRLCEYAEAVKKVEEKEEELEEAGRILTESKDKKLEEAASMQLLIDAKQEEVEAFNEQIGTSEEQVNAYMQQIEEQNAQIEALEAALAEQKRLLEEQNRKTRNYDGGMFTFPCPSYTRISDDYGMRMHPTLGKQMMHNGVDFAAPSGSPILAAYDGTVVSAAYSSSMGNYVMIDHGDGLITLYMHASRLLVSSGEDVTAGQKIALVGSTGRSTGPHLHFGVRKNGSYVSPWNYLK